MLNRIVFIGISLLISLSFAQAPDTLWTKLYGTSGVDYGTSVLETYDGGYLISANTGNPSDFWILKTDSLGDTLWTRTYGVMVAEVMMCFKHMMENSLLQAENH